MVACAVAHNSWAAPRCRGRNGIRCHSQAPNMMAYQGGNHARAQRLAKRLTSTSVFFLSAGLAGVPKITTVIFTLTDDTFIAHVGVEVSTAG